MLLRGIADVSIGVVFFIAGRVGNPQLAGPTLDVVRHARHNPRRDRSEVAAGRPTAPVRLGGERGQQGGRGRLTMSFNDAALAALCNSERRLIQRWGARTGRTVGRHLLELAAVDATTVDRLPGASVSLDGNGNLTVTFHDSLVICGVVTKSYARPSRTQRNGDHILITSLSVHGSDQ